MEAKQIRRIYEAMADNGFSTIEVAIGPNNKIRLQLDEASQADACVDGIDFPCSEEAAEIPRTQVEIRSDKVGVFSFADRQLQVGDTIRKGEILGTIKGISFQDKVKCSLDGVLETVFIENGSVVDYGRLLFVVNID